jgi:hypothetical protein
MKVDIDALAEEHGLELNAIIDLDNIRKWFAENEKCPCGFSNSCGEKCKSFWDVVKDGLPMCHCQLFRRPDNE